MREYLLKKDNRGFSMVELAIALAIVGVMAAFSVPILNSSMRDMRLIGDARGIAAGLTNAKLSAAAQMAHYRLSFDLANNRWSTAKQSTTGGSFVTQGAVNSLTNAGSSIETVFKSNSTSTPPSPSGFSSASSPTITFNSRGIPIEGLSVIYISNSAVNYAVTVSLAGRIQLLRLTQGQWVSQ
jgi:prepilin-type N-terminal cleavage/methylation domain-containing protein